MGREFKSGVTDWSIKNKGNLYKFEKGVLQAIGEKFGTEFIILDESSDINAKYLTGTNRIVVYRNADGGVMLRSAAHETYHFVEGYSRKDADDLRDYVTDALKGNGVDIEKALKKYAKQGYATRDEQISELVADSMFDVFSNEDFIKDLTAKNQTLAKRLANHIGELVQKIREAVKMLSVRYSNPEIKALMDDAEKLDTIRNMLLEGYKNAGENFKAEQAKGQKNNADGTAVKGIPSSKIMTDEQRAEAFKVLPIKAVPVDANKIDNADIESLKTKYKSEAREIIIKLADKFGDDVFKKYQNNAIELSFEYSKKKLKESINYQDGRFDSFAKMLGNLDELIDKAVPIEQHGNKYEGTIREDPSLNQVYVLLSLLQDGTKYIPVQFEIKEFVGKNNVLHLTVALNEIEANALKPTSVEKNGENDSDIASIFIIADVVKKINPADKNFLKYIPSALLDEEQIKAKEDSLNKEREKIAQLKEGKRPNQIFSVKQNLSESDAEYLDNLKSNRSEFANEYRKLRLKIDEIKSSAEYKAFDDEVRTIRKDGSRFGGFEAVKQVRQKQKEWAKSAGLSALEERFYNISEQIHDYDLEIYKLDKAQKERVTAELSDKVKKFSHSEVTEYVVRAAQKFGITKKFDNAGYMLTNGNLLDFSDGQGYRVLDHREIRDVLDFLPDNGNRSDGLIQFMNMGNIRMQIGGIDISKAPNKQQIPVLREFFNKNKGEITVDFSKENGDNAGSIEYPIGTSSEKILNDIKTYFENGTLPQISSSAAFHAMYSMKQTDPIQAHYAEVMRENRNLKNIISALDDMQYSSARNNIHLNGRDIHNIAGRLLKSASSKYELKAFEDELTAVYDYMANGREVDTEAVFESILGIANRVSATMFLRGIIRNS